MTAPVHTYPSDLAWDQVTGIHLLETRAGAGGIILAIRIDYYTDETYTDPGYPEHDIPPYERTRRTHHRWFLPAELEPDFRERIAETGTDINANLIQALRGHVYYEFWANGITVGSSLTHYCHGVPPANLQTVDLQDIALNDEPLMCVDTRNKTLFNRDDTGEWTRAPMVPYTHISLGDVDDFTLQVGASIDALAQADRTMPEAAGGWGDKTYTMDDLPDGITFDPETRELAGAPTTAANSAATYTVTDADGSTASADVMFIITSAGE